MTIPDSVYSEIEKSIEQIFEVNKEISANSEGVKSFHQMWESENYPEFIYGHMMGEIFGVASTLYNGYLKRPLTKEEMTEIADMVKSFKVDAKKIRDNLKLV